MNFLKFKTGILCAAIILISAVTSSRHCIFAQPVIRYSVSMPDPASHILHTEMRFKSFSEDSSDLKMPVWMPGYYQVMDYPQKVSRFSAKSSRGSILRVSRPDNSTWRIYTEGADSVIVTYDVAADRKFVACNLLDTAHCYIVPAATFMYEEECLPLPVHVRIVTDPRWSMIATGLDKVDGEENTFFAPDFDILYDSPFLAGKLEELPRFEIEGIAHRFIAFQPGSFNRDTFIQALSRVIREGTRIMGDIPYSHYTFIGTGPGYGGIEHLNNTTVSFNGNNLDNPAALQRVLLFLAHEYFHNYNVKRIRPFELGPFDYSRENRTNLLWVSEGLTVYYEYLMVRRAGLMTDKDLYRNIAGNIAAYENDPGRKFQSLVQASYNTWSDGPFGNKPSEADRAISYYEKGPLAGLILDFTIRNATGNKKSLDDVMRHLYIKYYKELKRGFTDAEFQQACEDMAGISLSREFEYVTTVKEIDYQYYFSLAGLKVSSTIDSKGMKKFTVTEEESLTPEQSSLLMSWLKGSQL